MEKPLQALTDKPTLSHWTIEYYEAFMVLNDSRQIREGSIGPIPLSEMAAYMEMFGVKDIEERERFTKMVKALDRVYMKHMNAKLKHERESARKRAQRKAPRAARRK